MNRRPLAYTALLLFALAVILLFALRATLAGAAPLHRDCINVTGTARVDVIRCGLTGCQAALDTVVRGRHYTAYVAISRSAAEGDTVSIAGRLCGTRLAVRIER